jgi:hypothetical protein
MLRLLRTGRRPATPRGMHGNMLRAAANRWGVRRNTPFPQSRGRVEAGGACAGRCSAPRPTGGACAGTRLTSSNLLWGSGVIISVPQFAPFNMGQLSPVLNPLGHRGVGVHRLRFFSPTVAKFRVLQIPTCFPVFF